MNSPEGEKVNLNSTNSASHLSRIWFAWFILVALFTTIPTSFLQIIGHQFQPDARNFKRWSGLWGRTILRLSGVKVKVKLNTTIDRSRSYVFVSNHENLLDILILSGYLPFPFGFVAKTELRKVPFLGLAIRNSASVFIDRSDPRKSLESLKKAGERIRNGNSVLMFPEGTRSYGPSMISFKKGAFALALEAGVPIVPVAIVDSYNLMDERRYGARPGTVHVVVGTPIETVGKRRSEIPSLMDAVKSQIESELIQK